MSREGYKKCEMGNDLQFIDELINEILLILVEEASDDFWKILKYGATDALINPSYTITTQDKYDMIKQNNVDSDGNIITKIKTIKFNNDISTEAHTEMRVFDNFWTLDGMNDYGIALGFEVISHSKIINLDGVGKRTINVLRHEIYRIFNNAEVYKNIGKLTNVGTRGSVVSFNENFQGYQFTLFGRSA